MSSVVFENRRLQIFVDGDYKGDVFHDSDPEEGDTLEDPIITAALEGREIDHVSFIGTMVMITTTPAEDLLEENENE